MHGTVNNGTVKCLIDTGSTSSLIKKSVFKRIGLDYHTDSDKLLRSFNGSLVPTLGSVNTLMQLSEANITVSLIVVKDGER